MKKKKRAGIILLIGSFILCLFWGIKLTVAHSETFVEVVNDNRKSTDIDRSNNNFETNNDKHDSLKYENDYSQIHNESDDLDALLSNIAGTYEYTTMDGTYGELIINKNDYGTFDIVDSIGSDGGGMYADSSNIIKYNEHRMFLKYPKNVYSDDYVLYEYYILEVIGNDIHMYYGDESFDCVQELYTAKKTE